MTGLVGVLANDSARYSLFSSCIDKLELPPGWKKEWLIGGDWCGARNSLCEMVLESGYSHLWFMDDDHAFPPQMLTKLLTHDLPLVTPICLTRIFPFKPVQYTEKLEGEFQYLPIPLSHSETEGLVELQASGCAGMLIRRDVIEAIEPPWFEYSDRSEDIIFCEKARAAGFTIHGDLSCRLGHITTAVVWPAVSEEEWKTGLTIGRDLNLIVEPADFYAENPTPAVDSSTTWAWQLRRVVTDEVIVQLEQFAGLPFSWRPGEPLHGLLQLYVDRGDGWEIVGEPFTYTEEA